MNPSEPATTASAAAAKPPVDGVLPVLPPLAVDASTQWWQQDCDVLVAGFGGAGSACAIAAKEAGAEVLITERFEGGGATQRSGGVIYAGGGTPHQRQAGYEDTPEQMFRYLRLETGDAVSETTLRSFCNDSKTLLEWVQSLGVGFEVRTPVPKTSYPNAGWDLYYSGNETIAGYADQATPAPRGHRCHDTGMAGRVLFAALRRRVEALGIPVWRRSAVRRLIVDSRSGAVIGAELYRLTPGSPAETRHRKLIARAERFHEIAGGYADRLRAQALRIELAQAQPVCVRARGGVVLTTGGFIFDRTMVGHHAPAYLRNLRLGTSGCDGSGIRIGGTVGGAVARMDKLSAWRFINPPLAWARGLVVGRNGRRFANEQCYGAKLGVELCEHHDGQAWLILDSTLWRASLREAVSGKLWAFQAVPALVLALFAPRARTIEALGAKLNIPADTLAGTLEDYNRAARGERADAYGKKPQQMAVLKGPRYYALNLAHSALFPLPTITLGGLRVDERSGAVLDAGGQPVTGLYAAGRAAVGIASNGYVSGLSIADCLWSGRRAGARTASLAREQAMRAA